MAQRPVKKRTCEYCGRHFFSRSSLSKFCCSAHQMATWRANNKLTQEELEQKFNEQEMNKEAAA